MPKFRFTLKRSKRWSRRAKSDGSCKPPPKKPKKLYDSSLLRVLRRTSFTMMALMFLSVFGIFLWFAIEILGVPGWFGYSKSMTFFGGFLEIMQWLNYATGLCFAVYFVVHISSIIRFRKKLVQYHLQLCPQCGYDLSSRVEDSPCSECGQQISRRELVRIWCRYLH